MVQLSYVELTRHVSRRRLLGLGGLLFGGGFAAQALAVNFATFALPNLVARVGQSPQHPVGNGMLAEQFPVHRRGFAISAHIAGGNVGTVVVAVIGAPLILAVGWRGTSFLFGLAAALIALAVLWLIREHGTDRGGGAGRWQLAPGAPAGHRRSQTCAGCSSPRSWAAAAAASAWSTCSRSST